MLAAFTRTEPVAPAAAAVPFWQRWPRRWLVPAGALAAAAFVLVVVTREGEPPAERQMARLEAPAPPSTGARGQEAGLAAPSHAPEPRPGAQPPVEAVGLADQITAAAPATPPPATLSRQPAVSGPPAVREAGREDRARSTSGRNLRDGARSIELNKPETDGATRPTVSAGVRSVPYVAGVPTLPTSTADTPTAAPAEAPATVKPAAPKVTTESERMARAEAADQSTTKLDSVQITNMPLDKYRNYQALVVLVPGESAAAAKTAGTGAVIAEIVSEPRPAFGRAGRGGAGKVPARGPAAAAEAAQAASDAAKLPSTIAARWRILANGTVERSVNAGATWHPLALDAPVALTAGSSPSDEVAWFVGLGGVVLLSTDGERLDRLSFPNTSNLVEVVAVTDRAATVRTEDGRTFVTGDGGRTWSAQ
jgi:hypothetical protein